MLKLKLKLKLLTIPATMSRSTPRQLKKVGYAGRRKPKYTITVEDFRELLPKSYACREQYHLLRIPLEDGRFELVSTSLVEIEYY